MRPKSAQILKWKRLQRHKVSEHEKSVDVEKEFMLVDKGKKPRIRRRRLVNGRADSTSKMRRL